MSKGNSSFQDRLVQAAGASSAAASQHRHELSAILERRLTRGDRWARVVTLVFALAWTGICGWLFAQGEDGPLFPVVPPLAMLLVGAWYLGYAVLFCFSAVRARFSERKDGMWFRTWNLCCSALLGVVLLLWWGYRPDIEQRSFYAAIIIFGFVVLASDAILHRIKCAEIANRENLLEIQIAILEERSSPHIANPPEAVSDGDP